MDKCLLRDFREVIDENEKENDGRQLFALREDGYVCRYFKVDNEYYRLKFFYDLSICDKEWFERKLKEEKTPEREKYPFINCEYDETRDPEVGEKITVEEYLRAKEKAIELSKERRAKIPAKKKARLEREQEHNDAEDGKTAYEFEFRYNGYIQDEVYVRAYNSEEAKRLAKEKHAEFTKDWAYPDAHKLAKCCFVKSILPVSKELDL